MDFETDYARGLEEFQQEVRQWLEANVPKDAPRAIGSEPYTHEEYLWRRKLARQLGEKGWLFPTYPKEYGGGGLSANHAFIIAAEVEKYGMSFQRMCVSTIHNSGATVGAPSILIWGTEEQRRAFLPPMLRGETVTWQLLTEPQGGSDVASTLTRAVRDGDEYVVNGQKIFVGGPFEVDNFWTIVNTDPTGPRHQNLSFMMIPTNLPGITIHPLDLCTIGSSGGVPGGPNNSVFFDNLRVPAFNLVGGENSGWKVASTHLEYEHGGAGSPVAAEGALEEFFAYCKSTQFQSKPLSHDPEVRDLLADIRTEAHVNRLLGMRNFWKSQAKQPMSYEGSQATFYRRMSTLRNAHRIQQIVGYRALTGDPAWTPGDGRVEVYVRHGFGGLHGAGTHDVDRVIIARRMGLGRNVKEEAGHMV